MGYSLVPIKYHKKLKYDIITKIADQRIMVSTHYIDALGIQFIDFAKNYSVKYEIPQITIAPEETQSQDFLLGLNFICSLNGSVTIARNCITISKNVYTFPTNKYIQIAEFARKRGGHKLHSQNAHLNGLTDLVISLANHLEIEKDNIFRQIDNIIGSITENSRFLRSITENLDFIKNQNEHIITEFKKIKFMDKKPPEDLPEIAGLTKALEKLKLDNNQRIVVKPTKYNHWLPRK